MRTRRGENGSFKLENKNEGKMKKISEKGKSYSVISTEKLTTCCIYMNVVQCYYANKHTKICSVQDKLFSITCT